MPPILTLASQEKVVLQLCSLLFNEFMALGEHLRNIRLVLRGTRLPGENHGLMPSSHLPQMQCHEWVYDFS